MKKIIHRAADRGIQDHGWLRAAHSFSFAQYHDPLKSHFGLLRVLNDDIIAAGMGFGTHGLYTPKVCDPRFLLFHPPLKTGKSKQKIKGLHLT